MLYLKTLGPRALTSLKLGHHARFGRNSPPLFCFFSSVTESKSQDLAECYRHRLKIWLEEETRQNELAKRDVNSLKDNKIKIVYNGQIIEGSRRVTTPLNILDDLSRKDSSPGTIAALVKISEENELVWDLTRPLENDCEITALTFDDPKGKEVFWHSTAHLLGFAIEKEYGDKVWLCDGPAERLHPSSTALVPAGGGGFFYEMEIQDSDAGLHLDDSLKKLKSQIHKLIKNNIKFERMEIDYAVAKDMFRFNPHKIHMLEKIKGSTITAYKCGDFVDLCRGPHVSSSKVLGVTKLVRTGASHIENSIGDNKTRLLQRVYGISFPSKAELKDWEARTLEAEKRDHRLIGAKQKLLAFHQWSPGSAFLLPHGTIIYNRLLAMIRDEYQKRGYDEVISPLIYSQRLWEKSGHWENYKENMFAVVDAHEDGAEGTEKMDEPMGLKPMNCPGHCLLYAHSLKSYRDLPVRMADFSALHRNELSGALGGLTRLRRFHQDDAHIFCTTDQVQEEILSCLEFVKYVYRELFGFDFSVRLSTRPEKSIGNDEEWIQAESALHDALNESGLNWDIDHGEGAFYGPKIDISVTDALAREHQCATIQLDFQLPIQFDLKFKASSGEKPRPVMIHRAVLGSLERFLAILMEHTAGKWPFWLSPRQICVIPVDYQKHGQYAKLVCERLSKALSVNSSGERETKLSEEATSFLQSTAAAGVTVELDSTSASLSKRVRDAQQAPFNILIVIGDRELEDNTLSIRSNDGSVNRTVGLNALINSCSDSILNRKNEVFPAQLR